MVVKVAVQGGPGRFIAVQGGSWRSKAVRGSSWRSFTVDSDSSRFLLKKYSEAFSVPRYMLKVLNPSTASQAWYEMSHPRQLIHFPDNRNGIIYRRMRLATSCPAVQVRTTGLFIWVRFSPENCTLQFRSHPYN